MPLSIEGLWAVAKLQAQLALWLNPRARQAVGPLPQSWSLADHYSHTVVLSTNETLSQPAISVVIPALNEARQLPAVLDTIHAANLVEVIVVDGGSADGTAEVAEAQGARVVKSAPGRSYQLNCGAAAATGSLLLFLHADTRLPEGFDRTIRQTLAQPGVVAGAFRLTIDGPGRGLRWVERGVNLRSRLLQMPYGDQAIFLKAEAFHNLGGFPELPMMEDFELMRRLRKVGKVALAPSAVVTSDRRWRTLGILRTTLANQAMIAGYLLGVDPHKLARWYRHLGKPCK
ncbi:MULTISPECIES: TIGR04283 family arsenosugar biosynthesis glycosyltransferase [Cyanophyceae]|uniref:TIGR04283 family arsenosugar biosynthesis glycosyltransferase n=1 Tax=Cyanophyceae TaxID=3028117 RepID=UPI00168A1D31|nr:MULTISPECIES: TIGR04283 family arsenosugar biosynthesis glycosyltransferase [Cyanophyceae]MBD1917019.1 TIGR04283 family arsenosugar biosynthesis glycosyltransferase [Phormidium sp. FACHB-77]MBD2029870.1 TIGR04283 family arsenosugar biosynthesis glycosyltransferase [Phormidium sp. FACHB-322]MBD2050342.1 TIGR04283 family arsenosugar biosynthesis glycosyltransferase [Leptolyngbya sp. FACHB-60]